MDVQERDDLLDIDILRLFRLLCRRSWIILLSMVLAGAICLSCAILFVAPQYTSSVMMYVNNTSVREESLPSAISSSDLSAARTLLDLYVVILKSRGTLEAVIAQAELPYTYEELYDRIRAGAVDGTEIFRIEVTDRDPAQAKRTADTIAEILPRRISGIVEGSDVRLVDEAVVPVSRSSPSYVKYASVGMLIGLLAGCCIVIVPAVLDRTVWSAEYLRQQFDGIPVLTLVPADKNTAVPDRSLAVKEACRRLRTNVFSSFAGENGCHVIGVTSAAPGEGKSTIAVSLAYDMLKAGKKVLFLDGDLHSSGVVESLSLRSAPGLCDILAGTCHGEGLVQQSSAADNLPVIVSGDAASAKTDLLSSPQPGLLLETLKQSYEYIIVDMPAASVTADAQILGGLTDGMLLVVRQGSADRMLLDDTVRQLQYSGVRILGFVMNGIRKTGR